MNRPRFLSILSLLAAGALLGGCDDPEYTTAPDEEERLEDRARAAGRDIREGTAEAWSAFADYSVEKKDEAVDFLESRTEGMDERIAEFRERAANARGEAKEEYEEIVETLQRKRSELSEQIDRLDDASEENWEELKAETQEEWQEFMQYVREKRNELQS